MKRSSVGPSQEAPRLLHLSHTMRRTVG